MHTLTDPTADKNSAVLQHRGGPADTGPSAALLVAVELNHDVIGSHRDKSGSVASYDYQVTVVRHGADSYAAYLVYNDEVNPGRGYSTRWEYAAPATHENAVARALATPVRSDTLVDLFDTLQQSSRSWPAPPGVNIPGVGLHAPRLAACRAILRSSYPEAEAVRVLHGLGAFEGTDMSGEYQTLSTRLAWHVAQETILRHLDLILNRYLEWRTVNHPGESDAKRRYWIEGGIQVVGLSIARMPSMLEDPPLDGEGLVESGHLLRQVDEWLATKCHKPARQTTPR